MRRHVPVLSLALLASLILAITAFAAVDRTLKVDGAATAASWDGEAFPALNQSFTPETIGLPIPLGTCGKTPLDYCEDTLVNVGAAGRLKVTLDGFSTDPVPPPVGPLLFDDYDLWVYESDKDGAIGDVAGASAGGPGEAEVVEFAATSGFYVVRAVYYATLLGGYKGHVELIGAAAPAPAPGATPTPAGTPAPTPSPGSTPAPGPTPTATPAPRPTAAPQKPSSGLLPPKGPLVISFAADRGKRTTARKRGIRVRLRCSVQCKATAVASVDAKVARRLKLGNRRFTLGRGSATIVQAGRIPFLVKLNSKARRALARKRVRKFPLSVTIHVRDLQNSQLSRGTKRITLR